MQRKTKILAAGGLAALLVAGGLAGFASAHMKGEGHGGGMRGEGHGRGGMMGQEMMARYDANKDGSITQAEIDQNRTQWYGEFDADKNGGLTLQEFTNLWLKARNEMIVREFQFFDRDGNGTVTLEEYRLPMQDLVASRDRNGDGALSRDDRGGRGGGPGRHGRHGMDDDDDDDDGRGPDGPPAAGEANP